MTSKLPVIHVPTVESKITMIKLIYQSKMQWGSTASLERALRSLERENYSAYPYIYFTPAAGVFFCTRNLQQIGDDHTLVNSPAHMIAYCKEKKFSFLNSE